jgi:transmembrane sensor
VEAVTKTAADPVTAEHHQQALAWLVTMWSGDVSADDQRALDAWRRQSDAHEQAWLAVQQMDQRLRHVPAPTASQVLRTSSDNKRSGRRAVLRGLALVGGTGLAAHLVRDTRTWHAVTARYTTATGERRELVLGDGTRIVMNTATALDVHFTAGQRRIDLHRGEIMIVTGKDHGARYRPFVVHTAHGAARALGTRFSVYQHEADTEVAVYEGAVEVRPLRAAAAVLRLAAGSATRFTGDRAERERLLAASGPAWLRGVLEAEQMPLPEFLAELARYRQGVIQCDPALAGERVSGIYPLADTDKILAALGGALPVRVSYRTRYWVKVQAR